MRGIVRIGLTVAIASVATTAAFALDPGLARQAVSEKRHDRWEACSLLAKDGTPEAMKLLLAGVANDNGGRCVFR